MRWIIILSFFALSIVNTWFGLLGFLCMAGPFYHALKRKRRTLSLQAPLSQRFLLQQYTEPCLPGVTLCPGLWLQRTSATPFWHLWLLCLSSAWAIQEEIPEKLPLWMFRFMGVSFIFGILLGFFFKPKSFLCCMPHEPRSLYAGCAYLQRWERKSPKDCSQKG